MSSQKLWKDPNEGRGRHPRLQHDDVVAGVSPAMYLVRGRHGRLYIAFFQRN